MPRKSIRVSQPVRIGLVISIISMCLTSLWLLYPQVFAMAHSGQTPDQYHWNATLHAAVEADDVSTVLQVLRAGAKVNEEWGSYPTPICEAIRNDSVKMMLTLLEWGANVNQKMDSSGATPLHDVRSPEMVRILLQHHANPNLRDNDGLTPLDWALDTSRGNMEIGGILLEWSMPVKDRAQIIELLRKAGAKTGKELTHQPTSLPNQ